MRVENVAIDAHHRKLVSVAGHELRIWSLQPSPLVKASDLPCKIFNIASSPNLAKAVMDGADGKTRIWTFANNTIQETSAQHTNMAFGVAWLGELGCSGGFDGLVLCAASDHQPSQVIATNSPVRWLTGTSDHRNMIIATADGRVLAYDTSIHTLYSQQGSPYRVALSSDDKLLASGSSDGSVVIYDYANHKIIRTIQAHHDLVMNVAWRGHNLWTAGRDRSLKQWSIQGSVVTLVKTIFDNGGFRLFHLTKDGWVANIAGHFIRIDHKGFPDDLKFDLGQQVDHIDVSPDGNNIVICSDVEVLLIDLLHNKLATFNVPTGGNGRVGFLNATDLVISTEEGLFTADFSKLSYIPFANSNN